jgi:hypothetical protein
MTRIIRFSDKIGQLLENTGKLQGTSRKQTPSACRLLVACLSLKA